MILHRNILKIAFSSEGPITLLEHVGTPDFKDFVSDFRDFKDFRLDFKDFKDFKYFNGVRANFEEFRSVLRDSNDEKSGPINRARF